MQPLKNQSQMNIEAIQMQIAQDYKISHAFKIKCYNQFNPNTQIYNPYLNSDSESYFEKKILHIRNYVLEVTKRLIDENPNVFPISEENHTCHIEVISNYQFAEEQIEKLQSQNKDYRSGFSALGPTIPHIMEATTKIFTDILIQSENTLVEFHCNRQVSAEKPYISFTFKVKSYDI